MQPALPPERLCKQLDRTWSSWDLHLSSDLEFWCQPAVPPVLPCSSGLAKDSFHWKHNPLARRCAHKHCPEFLNTCKGFLL